MTDFRPESDVDFLVTYTPERQWKAWGELPEQTEMEDLLGRKIDWVTRKSVEYSHSPLFRRAILKGTKVIYVAVT